MVDSDTSYPTIIDIPFVDPPFFRLCLRIDESHQEGNVTVVDKCEIYSVYIMGEKIYNSSPTTKIGEDSPRYTNHALDYDTE